MIQDISYQAYKKSDDIHGTVLYPAVMVAPVQKDILLDIMKGMDISSVFDPFHGSGTSLYEAFEASDDISLIGCDINPLANLITRAKLQGVTKDIANDIEKLKMNIANYKEYSFTFNNMEKWFREDISAELKKIKQAISKIECKKNRVFFWCMMCDIVRKYCNSRSCTYKLHVKEESRINDMKNNVVIDFISSVEKNASKYNKCCKSFELYKCDVLKKIIEFPHNTFDISITSPPYGENATTVTYGQFSSLALNWIDKVDLQLQGWELDNYSIIDSNSLGGTNSAGTLTSDLMKLVDPYISKISEDKKKKVLRFFSDYFLFLRELCRVTKSYIVLTLGNRTVSGVKINLTDISMRFIESNGFTKKQILMREIPNKRMPKVLSKTDSSVVNSMNQEYVIIAYKHDI